MVGEWKRACVKVAVWRPAVRRSSLEVGKSVGKAFVVVIIHGRNDCA